MSTGDPTLIDRVTRVTPLGVRFWDVMRQAPVQGGLIVTAFRPDRPGQRLSLFANRVGVYVASGVPGLRDFEFGAGDDAFWASAPAPQPYIIEVIDTEDRFLPFVFEAAIPTRWLFQWPCGAVASPPASPLESPPASPADAVPMYSTPYRPLVGGAATVRAQLYDLVTNKPAAYAVLSVLLRGALLGKAVSDETGSVTVTFAYPPEEGSAELPLSDWEWTVSLEAAYADLTPTWQFPDLCDVLEQNTAQLWETEGSPPTAALNDQTLRYGQDLIVRSVKPDGTPLPVLYITP